MYVPVMTARMQASSRSAKMVFMMARAGGRQSSIG